MTTLENYELNGTQLKIFTYPAKVLTQKAVAVTEFNQELKDLVKDMLFTMYHAPGIGLAAPQIGKGIRLFVLDVEYDREVEETSDGEKVEYSNFHPQVFINPEIITSTGKTTYKEGCLSVPEIYEDVVRSEQLVIKYQDLDGKHHETEATGLLAICIQHEYDHLEGVVFIDRLSNLKRNFFKKKLLKQS